MKRTIKSCGLALETGIYGGSVSLFSDDRILDFWCGDILNPRVDELVKNISLLLEKNSVSKTCINKILYSVYPGSHTALKIGASTATGLHLALGAELHKKNLFECILNLDRESHTGNLLIVLPVNKSVSVFCLYDENKDLIDRGEIKLSQSPKKMHIAERCSILTTADLQRDADKLKKSFGLPETVKCFELNTNLSFYIGFG